MGKISIQNGIISSSADFGLYHGTDEIATITSDGMVLQGDITAQKYIVSSSVSYMTQSFSSGSTKFGDSSDDTHQFTGSVSLQSGDTSDFFLLKSGSFDSLTINGQGVLTLGGFSFDPDAVAGGFYYSSNDNEFYMGKS